MQCVALDVRTVDVVLGLINVNVLLGGLALIAPNQFVEIPAASVSYV